MRSVQSICCKVHSVRVGTKFYVVVKNPSFFSDSLLTPLFIIL